MDLDQKLPWSHLLEPRPDSPPKSRLPDKITLFGSG